MKTTIKLFMALPHYYQELEQRLEQYAKEGLIFKKIGNATIKLEKSEPQDLKYRITYFKEGDIYNPRLTDNQLTYIDYAKESGWDFVCQRGQFQVFCSSLANPVELETDEQEKLDNIHKCMKKNLLKPNIILLAVLLSNLVIRTLSFDHNAMDFIQSNVDIGFFAMILFQSVLLVYSLLNYFWWYKKSQKSIDLGDGIRNTRSTKAKVFERTNITLIIASLAYCLLAILQEQNIRIEFVVFPIIYAIFLLGLFRFVIYIQKQLNVPAKTNKIISITIYLLVSVICFNGITYMGFQYGVKSLEPTTNENFVTKDDFPLSCEQLYQGENDDNYLFELDVTNTIFLKKEEYSQEKLDEFYVYGEASQLSYTIYTSWLGCVEDYVFDNIIDEYTRYVSFDILEELDNEFFGTQRAYILKFNANRDSSLYILAYDDMVVYLNCDFELNEGDAKVVQKCLLGLDFVLI